MLWPVAGVARRRRAVSPLAHRPVTVAVDAAGAVRAFGHRPVAIADEAIGAFGGVGHRALPITGRQVRPGFGAHGPGLLDRDICPRVGNIVRIWQVETAKRARSRIAIARIIRSAASGNIGARIRRSTRIEGTADTRPRTAEHIKQGPRPGRIQKHPVSVGRLTIDTVQNALGAHEETVDGHVAGIEAAGIAVGGMGLEKRQDVLEGGLLNRIHTDPSGVEGDNAAQIVKARHDFAAPITTALGMVLGQEVISVQARRGHHEQERLPAPVYPGCGGQIRFARRIRAGVGFAFYEVRQVKAGRRQGLLQSHDAVDHVLTEKFGETFME